MKSKKLKIVYEDKYILVINKPEKLLTISNDKEKEKIKRIKFLLFID